MGVREQPKGKNMEPTTSDLGQEITRYAHATATREKFFKDQLENALRWLEEDIKYIRRSLETNTNVYADNIVAQATRVQDAGLRVRLAGEHRLELEDIISVNGPSA